jgi:hypothetical protein
MSSTFSKVITIGGALILVGVVTSLVVKVIKQQEEIEDLELKNLKLIKDSLIKGKEVTPEVDKQLKGLIKYYQKKYPSISIELKTALRIYEANEKEKALGSINICIENLLTEKYGQNKNFSKWFHDKIQDGNKGVSPLDYLDYSLHEKFISKEEYEYVKNIRLTRNKSYHIAGYKRDSNYNEANLLVGCNIIFKIGESII